MLSQFALFAPLKWSSNLLRNLQIKDMKKTKAIRFRVTDQEYKSIKELSEKYRLSMTELILKAVLEDGIFIDYTVVTRGMVSVSNQLNHLDETFKKFIDYMNKHQPEIDDTLHQAIIQHMGLTQKFRDTYNERVKRIMWSLRKIDRIAQRRSLRNP